MTAEKQFYDWAQKAFRVTEAKINSDKTKSDAAQRIIEAAKEGRVKFGETTAEYALAYPVGEIKTVNFNTRLKAKTVLELQGLSGTAQTYKFFEGTMSLPAAIVGELDLYDFTTLAGFFAFL